MANTSAHPTTACLKPKVITAWRRDEPERAHLTRCNRCEPCKEFWRLFAQAYSEEEEQQHGPK
jgi:hypothetical protein